ncbi:MAG: hypothetical protein RR338_00915 [Clostridia bacterium]
MKSILQKEKCCYACGRIDGLHLHHIYGGAANRKISDKNGFTVYLCAYHHNMSNFGVHFDKRLDLILKKECQREYEKTHSRKEFMALIGKNYLD